MVAVARLAGSTAGSTNRINNSTQRELLVFERNTGCTTCGYMWAQVQAQVQARARARVCPWRQSTDVKIEAAAPNLVLTALRRALRSQSLGMGA